MARNPKADVVDAAGSIADLELVTAPMVAVITSTAPRRRRAGRSFSATPVRIPVDQLSEADFGAISADPLLKIHMEPAEDPAGE